jgi:hypothetical protein
MAKSETKYEYNNERNKMNNSVNVLEKDVKLKRNLFLQYDVNNIMLLEDPKFRTLLLTKHWFTVKENDLYSKIVHNPILKEKDYEIIENIKNHHERSIDTLFYIAFIAYFFKIRSSFSQKKIKGLANKSFLFLSFPIILISYFCLGKPWYLNYRINSFALKNPELMQYTKLEIDLNLIDKELSKYKIRI